MTTNPVAEQPPSGPAGLQVLEAHIKPATVILGRPGEDYADVITYSDGKFVQTVAATRPGLPAPHIARTLQPEELRTLLYTLLRQPTQPPADRNLDLLALQAFIGILGPQVWSEHRDPQGHQ